MKSANTKKKLLIFSQCVIYGGCERLMFSIYGNDTINDNFNVTFSYSYFKEYKKELELDISNHKFKAIIKPLYLLTNGVLFYKINNKVKNKLIRKLSKLPFWILQKTGIYIFWNSINLILLLIKIKPEILHINNGGYPGAEACNLITQLSTFFPKIRVIYQINNTPQPLKKCSNNIFDNLLNKNVDIFITHSTSNKMALIKRGFNEEKVFSIPSSYNDPLINSTTLLNNNYESNFLNICSVGILTNRKGQTYLLNALITIKNNYPKIYSKIKLHLIGDGEDRSLIEKIISTESLDDNVKLWGKRKDYFNFIIYSDIFIFPSIKSEDMPLVILTAMKYKKCIIATNFAGLKDTLTNNFDSILVNPDIKHISDEISSSIIYLYNNIEKRSKLSENVYITYQKKFDTNVYISNLLNLYNNKLDQILEN